MSLAAYRKKRDFTATPEPPPRRGAAAGRRFVVQKHAATRLHYDFRLELKGTLKSWAVPKGLPWRKGERRLAVQVEDHPIAYGDFEGTIPRGHYGGGTVMLWDRGTYEPLTPTPLKDWKNGRLPVRLAGKKLRGEWMLVRMDREPDQWLIIKAGTSMKPPSRAADDRSVASGRTMRQLSGSHRVWRSEKAAGRSGKGKKPIRAQKKTEVPEFVPPMKAVLMDRPPAGSWNYEIKFDGWRALALKGGPSVQLLSRNQKEFGEQFPGLRDAVSRLSAGEVVLDGEIVALDAKGRSSFQLLQSALSGDGAAPIRYYVFDVLRRDGRSLTGRPIEERREILEQVLEGAPDEIRISPVLGSDAAALLREARKLGLEGLIGKRGGSRYEPGRRSERWIKLKLVREQEFVIGGFTEPQGSRKHFGALLVGHFAGKALQFAGKVGTGFTAASLRQLHERMRTLERAGNPFANLPDARAGRWGQGITRAAMRRCHWLKPELVGQVKFSEWTRDDRLRQPVFLGLREDKAARDVVREEPHGA